MNWEVQYHQIVDEFNYDVQDDMAATKYLNSILKEPNLIKLSDIIQNKNVAVIGAGPSLGVSIPVIKQLEMTIIAADSAVESLVAADITPDIVVTDLDGKESSLLSLAYTECIFVVHAHGDNIPKLDLAINFRNCIGTTQTKPYGNIQNFGGFTDGDRAVFLAEHFGAKRIILFGMDLGTEIGIYSNTDRSERHVKLQKLSKARSLLEWLGGFAQAKLYTTSTSIEGFKNISLNMALDLV